MDQNHNEVHGLVVGNVVQGNELTVTPPAAPPVAMAGLPAQPVFVGRDRELGLLLAALRAADEQAVVVWSLGGLGGIGKTALAVRAAQQALREGWFPGGVVMVNLRGYDPPSDRVSASAALASLLGALGVAGQHIPEDAEDRARLWRSVLAERGRTLIVADNASSGEQVRPLLPGTAGHRMVITSRHRLADLEGTRLLDLDLLSRSEAAQMLAEELAAGDPDDRRVPDDPRSVDALVHLCGGLPLAVRIAAAFLVADPRRSVAESAADLAVDRQRLTELDFDGSLAVRTTFDLSYRHLDASHARLFRLIALNTGPEISFDAMAALADVDVAEVRRSVRELFRAHLLQPGSAGDRWRMHDLVRLYAMEEAALDPEREAAIGRLLEHYRTTALTLLEPQSPAGGSHRYFVDRVQALAWADTEHVNLVAGITLAFETDQLTSVVALSLLFFEYFEMRGYWEALRSTHVLALSAARQLGDRAGESRILTNIGTAYRRNGQFDYALASYREALAINRAAGSRMEEGNALNFIGEAYRDMNMPVETIENVQQALAIFRELGSRDMEGAVMHNLGVAHRQLGRHADALKYHLSDLDICREHGTRFDEGRVLDHLGLVYRELGRFVEAVDHHRQNLTICREIGDRMGEFRTFSRLGVTYREWGRTEEAIDCLRGAARFFDQNGDHYLEAGVLLDLGLTFRRSGDLNEARRNWQAALEIYEGLPGAGPASSAEEVRALLATNE